MRKRGGKAIVLLSGGVDSSTALAIAKAEGFKVHALSFNYNQRHGIELAFARRVASSLKVERHLVTDIDLREIGGSALTSDIKVPKGGAASKKSRGGLNRNGGRNGLIPVTYVPARNTIFLSVALAWAEVLEADSIFIGANAVDYSGYPDCRPEYLKAFEDMANLATKISVEGRLKFRIRAPLISMKKSEIILKGIDLGLDYSLTWSCYDPRFSAKPGAAGGLEKDGELFSSGVKKIVGAVRPCGRCDSCRLRQKGFREAGVADPATRLFGENSVFLRK